MSLLYKIGNKPIIAALRDPSQIQIAINSSVDNIFFMGGTIIEVMEAVRIATKSNKGTFIHMDLVKGLSNSDREAVEFIKYFIAADGIVTPKSHLIKEAKRVGLYGILHLFILDSLALQKGSELIKTINPDGIELMPGIIEKFITHFASLTDDIPIIASGLIQTPTEAAMGLHAGATSLAVSEVSLWNYSFQQLLT